MGLRSRSRNPAGGLDFKIVSLNEKCAHGPDDLRPEPKVFFYMRLPAVFHIDMQNKGLCFFSGVKMSDLYPDVALKFTKTHGIYCHTRYIPIVNRAIFFLQKIGFGTLFVKCLFLHPNRFGG